MEVFSLITSILPVILLFIYIYIFEKNKKNFYHKSTGRHCYCCDKDLFEIGYNFNIEEYMATNNPKLCKKCNRDKNIKELNYNKFKSYIALINNYLISNYSKINENKIWLPFIPIVFILISLIFSIKLFFVLANILLFLYWILNIYIFKLIAK
jgi:hypothetical protein